jgi:O-antigen/teichoic acid export membrane protein
MNNCQKNSEIVERIIIGARWATFFRLIGQLISWGCTVFVVRFISQEDYGLNAMLEAPLEFLFLLSTLGIDSALIRIKNVERDEIKAAFGFLLLLNAGLFSCYFLEVV